MKIQILDYSEKAIAVKGDTRPIKDALKTLGGRFNPRLTDGAEKFAGWIFPKSKRAAIEDLLKEDKATIVQKVRETPTEAPRYAKSEKSGPSTDLYTFEQHCTWKALYLAHEYRKKNVTYGKDWKHETFRDAKGNIVFKESYTNARNDWNHDNSEKIVNNYWRITPKGSATSFDVDKKQEVELYQFTKDIFGIPSKKEPGIYFPADPKTGYSKLYVNPKQVKAATDKLTAAGYVVDVRKSRSYGVSFQDKTPATAKRIDLSDTGEKIDNLPLTIKIPFSFKKNHYQLSKYNNYDEREKLNRMILLRELITGKLEAAVYKSYDSMNEYTEYVKDSSMNYQDVVNDLYFWNRMVGDFLNGRAYDTPFAQTDGTIRFHDYQFRYRTGALQKEVSQVKSEYSQVEVKVIAESLKSKADSQIQKSKDKRNTSLKDMNYTPRRAGMIAEAERQADKLLRIGQALQKLSEMWQSNAVPPMLSLIRNISDVELLLDRPYTDPGKDSSQQYRELYKTWKNKLARLGLTVNQFQEAKDLLSDIAPKVEEDSKSKKIRELSEPFLNSKIKGFFPTPEELADKLVIMADIQPGMTVLEPEAGLGHIAEAILRAHKDDNIQLEVIEYSHGLSEILKLKGFNVVGDDFLQTKEQKYDRIIMNPPFEKGQDIEHVTHAYTLLRPGGRLVSIMANSVQYRSDKKYATFRDFVDDIAGTVEDLPAGSFKKSLKSTMVNTVVVTLDKPGKSEIKPRPEAKVVKMVPPVPSAPAETPVGYQKGKRQISVGAEFIIQLLRRGQQYEYYADVESMSDRVQHAKELQQKGWVTITQDSRNKNKHDVVLTAKGKTSPIYTGIEDMELWKPYFTVPMLPEPTYKTRRYKDDEWRECLNIVGYMVDGRHVTTSRLKEEAKKADDVIKKMWGNDYKALTYGGNTYSVHDEFFGYRGYFARIDKEVRGEYNDKFFQNKANRTPENLAPFIEKFLQEKALHLKEYIAKVTNPKLYQIQDPQEILDLWNSDEIYVDHKYILMLLRERFGIKLDRSHHKHYDFIHAKKPIADWIKENSEKQAELTRNKEQSAMKLRAGIGELFKICKKMLFEKGHKPAKANLTKALAEEKYRISYSQWDAIEVFGPGPRNSGDALFYFRAHIAEQGFTVDQDLQAAAFMIIVADTHLCMKDKNTHHGIWFDCYHRKDLRKLEAQAAEINLKEYYQAIEKEYSKKSAPQMTEYKYLLLRRPFSIGTYPENRNFVRFEDKGGRFGQVVYSEKLTINEIKNYELRPDLRTHLGLEKGSKLSVPFGNSFLNATILKIDHDNVEVELDNGKKKVKESHKPEKLLLEIESGMWNIVDPAKEKAASEAMQKIIDMPVSKANTDIEKELKLLTDFFALIDGKRDRESISSLMNRFDKIPTPSHEYKEMIEAAREKLQKIWSYMVKEKLQTIEIELTDKKFGQKLADTIAQSNYFDTAKYNESNQCYALNLPISSIHTDEARFQNRKDAFSEVSASNVAKSFDPNKFDPVVVWQEGNKIYVISGHSRLQGLKRRGAKTVPARFFQGSEQEAIQFAKVEANRSNEKENLAEDVAAFKLMRDGDSKKKIEASPKTEIKRVFKDRFNKLEMFSYLNPNGLYMQALSSGNTSEFPYVERTAGWVGQLKRDNQKINTNMMEDNLFGFFYNDEKGKNLKLSKDDFFKLVNKQLSVMKSTDKVIFTRDGKAIDDVKRLLEDKIKGEAYKKLQETNDLLKFMSDRLKTTDRKLKVWTPAEADYIKNTLAKRLTEEKQRLERDLNHLDKQSTLFGLSGCQYWKCAAAVGPDCECSGCMGTQHGLGAVKVNVCSCKPCQKSFKDALAGLGGPKPKKKCGKKCKDCKDCSSKKKSSRKPAARKPAARKPQPKPVVKPHRVKKKALSQVKGLAGLESDYSDPIPYTGVAPAEMPVAAAVKNSPEADVMKLFRKATEAPEVERETFTLPGNVGVFMGRIERFEYAVVLRGDRGAGKSTLVFRMLNSFAEWGMKSAFLSLEMNPQSSVFQSMLEKYVDAQNREKIMTTDLVNTIAGIREVAKVFPVVVIDSWTKLQGVQQNDFDKLRKEFPNTIFIIIFQSTTSGTARNGFMAEYDAGAVIQVYKDKQGGRAEMVKNRYSEGENLAYYVHQNKIVDLDQEDKDKDLAEDLLEA